MSESKTIEFDSDYIISLIASDLENNEEYYIENVNVFLEGTESAIAELVRIMNENAKHRKFIISESTQEKF